MAEGQRGRPRIAVILAGGRATRLGGADKPLLELGGRTLLDRAVSAARDAGCGHVVVAGHERADAVAGVVWVREEPPFGGPVAGLAAALLRIDGAWTDDGAHAEGRHDAAAGVDAQGTDTTHTSSRRVLVLPADLVDPAAAVDALLAADVPEDGGVCLEDPHGHRQWLTGIYPVAALRDGIAALPHEGRDASLRALVSRMKLSFVPASDIATRDVDTWEDLDQARQMLPAPDERHRRKDRT